MITLTEAELNLVREAMLGHFWTPGGNAKEEILVNVEDGIEGDDLAAKWGVNGLALVAKLARLTEEEWQALKLEIRESL